MTRSILFLAAITVAACSSTSETTKDGGADGGGDAAADTGPATCASPGAATPGEADTHCAASDAGPARTQPTSAASCHVDASGGGGDEACPYGDTMFGQEADDDDCKYHLVWSAAPICEGAGGVAFKVVVTNKGDKTPLTAANTSAEVFTTSPGDAGCDNQSTHPGPNSGVVLTEGPPGTYTGPIVFDQPGAWTVRFHFHEECSDLAPDSPHGHAAFHVTIP